jgi:DNA-binding XRE family transcriptional regulator
MWGKGLDLTCCLWQHLYVTGQELKQVRAYLGLTQAEMAQKIGVTRNTVARWEVGLRRIPEPIIRLVQFLAEKKHSLVVPASEAGSKGDTPHDEERKFNT